MSSPSDQLSSASDVEGSQASKNKNAMSDGGLGSGIDDLFGEDEDEIIPSYVTCRSLYLDCTS
jgi:hypothetical protein